MSYAGITKSVLSAAEYGWISDQLIRLGIRSLLSKRLQKMHSSGNEDESPQTTFLQECASSPIALATEEANDQHYEVPAEFFQYVLGPHLKYSCCHWEDGATSLRQAEESALSISCQRAELKDGHSILDLGCGWGSLSLWMAERFPKSQVTAVSNSSSQKRFIESQAKARGLENIKVMTEDINNFAPHDRFDRVVSVEMFEHVRNHRELFRRIHHWLKPDGLLFVHVFAHKQQSYFFEDQGPQDWMTRFFFSGGMMPSEDLFLNYQDDLKLMNRWSWNGRNYEKTSNAWLQSMDENKGHILSIFDEAYGKEQSRIWFQRWRIFFMACAELFGYRDGNEWKVCHYLFRNQES
ncbi:cyclopropane-fatty-acyl-phospholipid synthase family protein [Thalassoglobus sp. JC818]|uniref:SAM-dependent methyltransferase n=1 Tax=Thalassoglobus sp. JC818 TaxID=3232136 RepID=UPI00345A9CD5